MSERNGPGRRDLAVSGHVNIDRFLRVPALPAVDRTAPILSQRSELGGTAANVARAAAAHGVRVGLLSRVGDGFASEYRRQLSSEGIDLGGLRRVAGCATPTCYTVEAPSGAQWTLIDQGPMDRARGPPLRRSWLRRYAWVHVGTGPTDLQLRLTAVARDLGLRVAADPAQELFYRWDRDSLRSLLGASEILFGNRAEVAEAARRLGGAGARSLLSVVPLVVRTEGRGGVTAFSRVGREHVPAEPSPKGGSTVGAGDWFRGGFYGGFFAGAPLRACLVRGARSAAAWVRRRR